MYTIQAEVERAQVTGNTDFPENGLEGLAQVCIPIYVHIHYTECMNMDKVYL